MEAFLKISRKVLPLIAVIALVALCVCQVEASSLPMTLGTFAIGMAVDPSVAATALTKFQTSYSALTGAVSNKATTSAASAAAQLADNQAATQVQIAQQQADDDLESLLQALAAENIIPTPPAPAATKATPTGAQVNA